MSGLALAAGTVLGALWLGRGRRSREMVESVVSEKTQALHTAISSLAELHRDLEDSEERYRHLVEASPTAIVVERANRIVVANRAAVEMFGFDPTRASETFTLLDFVAADRLPMAKEVLRRLAAQDTQIAPREAWLVRRDGSPMTAEIAASSYLQGGERTIQVLIRDITQRKCEQAENLRLISAIEQAAESIVITDLRGNIVYVNPAFERVSGYTRAEAIGVNPRILKSGHQPPEYYAGMWQKLAAGESWTGKFINRSKDGRLYTEEVTISPVADRNGEVINYVAVKRDVTAENALQEQLHQSQKLDAIGRLAGGVAHDFNNMLMVINSYAELLAGDLPAQDPRRIYTDRIMRASERSASLTRQLLAFSRKQVFQPAVLDCNTLLSETVGMVRRLIPENIELKCELGEDVWPVKVDADQFVQVLLNLCLNARDAMPTGGTLSISSRNWSGDGEYVEIAVEDTGVGIPLEVQEKLFEPFFTTKGRGKGTGLGLSIVYGIVEQSGGFLRVESVPGQGACFRVFLPRSTEQAAVDPKPVLTRQAEDSSLVLVVEDEEALRSAIAEHLKNNGYRVVCAANGVEAMECLRHHPAIAVLITDLVMPRMGGRELVRYASQRQPELRIMVLSGYADETMSEEDYNGCPSAFLQKPFSLGLMMQRLAELRSEPARPAAAEAGA